MEKANFLINGEQVSVTVLSRSRNRVEFEYESRRFVVEWSMEAGSSDTDRVQSRGPKVTARSSSGDPTQICAPIPGVITAVHVAPGQDVDEGSLAITLEAMKMENSIYSAIRGNVREVLVKEGEEVHDGQVLVVLEADS